MFHVVGKERIWGMVVVVLEVIRLCIIRRCLFFFHHGVTTITQWLFFDFCTVSKCNLTYHQPLEHLLLNGGHGILNACSYLQCVLCAWRQICTSVFSDETEKKAVTLPWLGDGPVLAAVSVFRCSARDLFVSSPVHIEFMSPNVYFQPILLAVYYNLLSTLIVIATALCLVFIQVSSLQAFHPIFSFVLIFLSTFLYDHLF